MMWHTHVLFGLSTLWLLTPVPPEILQTSIGLLAASAALGSLMPDLDASESKIKHLQIPNSQLKPFLLPALIVSRSEQHRGLLHSLAGWGFVTLGVMPLIPLLGWAPTAAFCLGFGSHLLADAATKSGISLLYPRKARFYILPRSLRVTTGSAEEEIYMALLAPTVLLLFLMYL